MSSCLGSAVDGAGGVGAAGRRGGSGLCLGWRPRRVPCARFVVVMICATACHMPWSHILGSGLEPVPLVGQRESESMMLTRNREGGWAAAERHADRVLRGSILRARCEAFRRATCTTPPATARRCSSSVIASSGRACTTDSSAAAVTRGAIARLASSSMRLDQTVVRRETSALGNCGCDAPEIEHQLGDEKPGQRDSDVEGQKAAQWTPRG
jgi:hypothetical protein